MILGDPRARYRDELPGPARAAARFREKGEDFVAEAILLADEARRGAR